MSNIAVQGGAGGTGTVTLLAPSTSTDRTLTLPDQTATVITDSAAILNIGSGQVYKDASGNVVFGATSATYSAAGRVSVEVNGATDSVFAARTGGTARAYIQATSTQVNLYTASAIPLTLGTDNNERARIDSSGNLLVGATSPAQTMDGLFVKGRVTATGNQWNFLAYTQGGQMTIGCRDDYYLRSPAVYERTSAGAANVTVDGSGYLYRSTSSIRYKRDVVNYDKGLAAVISLRPVYYKSNVMSPDGTISEDQYAGFIAEEVAAAGLEEFVVRNSQGQPDALHYSNMVALLSKAIQEQQALITQLQADVAALKGTT